MKRMSKLLAFGFVIALILAMGSVTLAAPPDVAGTRYEQAVTQLMSLEKCGHNIITGDPGGMFRPHDTLSRAEAATILVRLKGLGSQADIRKGSSRFPDVPRSHWASGYITAAFENGWITGYPGGTFGPSDPVTYDEWITMLVRAMGYDQDARDQGGWPDGYRGVATSLQLTKDTSYNLALSANAIPRGEVAIAAYNAVFSTHPKGASEPLAESVFSVAAGKVKESGQGPSAMGNRTLPDGVNAEYTVTVTGPPDPSIRVRAKYSNLSAPLRLELGFQWDPNYTLEPLRDLQFESSDGSPLQYMQVDFRTIEIESTADSIIATYFVDLTKTSEGFHVGTKVKSIGGTLQGAEAFLTPVNQTLSDATVSFILPEPWQVVSVHPQEGGQFTIEPLHFHDLALETRISGWYFGNVDYDSTKTYNDGFQVRVVGFKYSPYRHWNAYLGNSALDQAIASADFYHETYLWLQQIFGEFPFERMLLVGPDLWQAGSTWMCQIPVGPNNIATIPHHMAHSYFSTYPGRVVFQNAFYMLLREGYSTYLEGFGTSELTGDPVWRGMLYERKFHYLRGPKFGNLEQDSRQYVLGFITTFLIDQGIKEATGGQQGINDLMATIWTKYAGPNPVIVSDEEVLSIIEEITGREWHSFYQHSILDTAHLDTSSLDILKDDFRVFLEAIANYWYNGHPSVYFLNQELVSAVGHYSLGVRFQSPLQTVRPLLMEFILEARRYKDLSQTDLTEADIEEVLHRVTGKDHSDFFEFYDSLGFEVDPEDISKYLKTFSHIWQFTDKAVRMTPRIVSLGQSTSVTAEILDPDFANASHLSLQINVYDPPIGMGSLTQLISGDGVSVSSEGSCEDEQLGSGRMIIFNLPKWTSGEKAHTSFTINLPEDAGVMRFYLNAKSGEPQQVTYEDWMGGFVGTKKVTFQDELTFTINEPGN